MSETQGQSNDSPLLSERGVTTISDTVVSSLAGMAAQEVEGVHMGGGASRAAGGVLGSITGSESKTSGISVEIGQTEVAIDLKMGIEYNKNILQTVEEVRQRITERVESTTGLRIKELNATITDITFPEKEAKRRIGPARRQSEPDESPQATTDVAPETRTTPQEETAEPAENESTQLETTEVDTTEPETTSIPTEDPGAPEGEEVTASVESLDEPEEEAVVDERPPEEQETVVEERPPEEDEITEARTEEQPVDAASGSETIEELQTPPAPETAEERMRRRAEERARRRRRRVQEEDS